MYLILQCSSICIRKKVYQESKPHSWSGSRIKTTLLENKNYKKGPLQEQAMSPQHEKKNKSTSIGMLSELSCVAEKPQWAEASSESWPLTGQTG